MSRPPPAPGSWDGATRLHAGPTVPSQLSVYLRTQSEGARQGVQIMARHTYVCNENETRWMEAAGEDDADDGKRALKSASTMSTARLNS